MSKKLPQNLGFYGETRTKQSNETQFKSFMGSVSGVFNNFTGKRDAESFKESDNDVSENTGLLNSIKNSVSNVAKTEMISSITNKTKNIFQGAQDQYTDTANLAKNLPYIILLCIVGFLLIMLSTLYLPLLVLFPQKFSSLFAMGSMCILIAISLIKGPKNFLNSLMTSQKIKYSAWYALSLTGTLYFSIFAKSYIFAMAFAISQVF